MTDKEIRRLSKTELLTIIRDQENALEQKEKEAEQYRKLSAAQETSADPADSSDASPAVSAASSDTSDSSGVKRPDLESLDRELARRSHRQLYRRTVRTTLWILIVAAAAAILIATLLLSALKVQGDSMEPTLEKDQILLAVRKVPIKKGDIVAFYYDNKILLKRVIAAAGDEVDIQDDGTVLVNGVAIEESYLTAKAKGTCDVTFPLQVPDGRLFVMGDNREVSIDSRSSAIGCVSEKSILGKVVLRIWPISRFGGI